MSDKLNQSLDDILSQRRKNARPTRARRSLPGRAAKAAAPVGGVKKAVKQPKSNEKVAKGAAPAPGKSGESKIQVSNLPFDVTEAQIKDYFNSIVGTVKRVLLNYGPNGQSRGVATVIFNQVGAAAKAAKELDGIHVDKKAMKIEVLVTAKDAPEVPQPKKLADRISQPKNAAKPKPATDTKESKAAGRKASAARGRGRGGRNAGRPKAKTADELDQEMTDYFASGANGDTAMAGGAVQPSNTGEAAMTDETL